MVPLKPAESGDPGATRRVRTEMTPPKASDPYATEPGPRETSTLSITVGVHERRARANAPFGADACAVDQDQRAAAREAADGGHRRLSLRDLIDAGHVLERLHQVRRLPHGDIPAADRRRAGSGARGDAGRGARHGDRLAHERRDGDHELRLGAERGDHHGTRIDAARIDHENLERRWGIGLPLEASIGIGDGLAGSADNRHRGAGHWPSLLIDDAGLESECRKRQRQHRQKDKKTKTHRLEDTDSSVLLPAIVGRI